MSKEIFEKICDYIIKEVAENSDGSMSGFQYCVNDSTIQEQFALEIHQFVTDLILDELVKRDEVADVIYDTDGFDVVLFTDYSPNYIKGDDEI